MDNSTSNLDAARAYAARGWPVLPVHGVVGGVCTCGRSDCPSPGKHPCTSHGVLDATTQIPIIETWWVLWPNANVAIATGERSGLLVVDIDTPEAWDEWRMTHPTLSDTLTSRTGGGGYHVLLQHPGEPIRNSVRVMPGVDIRADGGYIVAPPSLHSSGVTYEWAYRAAPIKAATPEVIEMISKGRERARYTPVNPIEVLAGVPAGERNDKLFRYLCSRVARGMTPIELKVLAHTAGEAARPPLDPAEVDTIVEHAVSYGQDETSNTEIVPLLPEELGEVEPFPLGMLPESLQFFVREVAESRQVPPDLPALFCLTTLAAVAQQAVDVQVGDTHSVPTNLFIIVALPPGARKSAVVKDCTHVLYEIERSTYLELKHQIRAVRAERTAIKGRMEFLSKQASREKDAHKRHLLLAEAAELEDKLPELPPIPQLLASGDSTQESIPVMMKQQFDRLAIMDTEASLLDVASGRYSKALNLDILLKAWEGDSHRVARIGRDDIWLERPLLTLGLAIQPDVLNDLSDTPALRSRGLLGRFLYAIPRSTIGTREYSSRGISAAAADAYRSAVLAVHSLSWGALLGDKKIVLKLDGDALGIWVKHVHDKVEQLCATGGELEHIQDWGSKLPRAVASIAGLLHLVVHAHDAEMPREIEADVMLRAAALAEYLISHSLAAYGRTKFTKVTQGVLDVAQVIERQGFTEFTRRELHRLVQRKIGASDELKRILAEMVERGLLTITYTKPKGRLRESYQVAPSFRESRLVVG